MRPPRRTGLIALLSCLLGFALLGGALIVILTAGPAHRFDPKAPIATASSDPGIEACLGLEHPPQGGTGEPDWYSFSRSSFPDLVVAAGTLDQFVSDSAPVSPSDIAAAQIQLNEDYEALREACSAHGAPIPMTLGGSI